MNETQKAYLDGASMAYKDVADKLDSMIATCPVEIKEIMEGMKPFANTVRLKAEEVYKEAERLEGIRH